MFKKDTKKLGFSLAEVMISLLIISIIAIATVPIISKKKRPKETNTHGRWECTYYNNRYTVKTVIDGVTSISYPSVGSCVFAPPAKAKNFSVTVVGGGGGGAAGSYPFAKKYYSTTSFTVPEYAEYKIAVVGGGGAGGTRICGTISQGGGSGGYVVTTKILQPGLTYTATVGRGGYCHNCNGGESSLSGNNINTIKATGGQAGNSRERVCFIGICDCKWTDARNGAGGSPGGVNGKDGGDNNYDAAGRISDTELQNFLGGNYGYGGTPRCFNPGNGIIGIAPTGVASGGAGTPGVVASRAYPTLKGPITVTLGMGGAKGAENGSAGTAGGTTKFGGMITAQGGLGGEPRYKVSATEIVKGENAQVPQVTKQATITKSYGGYTVNNTNIDATQSSYDGINGAGAAGAGGGGSPKDYGSGAPGRPGAVLIEW